jgi:hypothetical protein
MNENHQIIYSKAHIARKIYRSVWFWKSYQRNIQCMFIFVSYIVSYQKLVSITVLTQKIKHRRCWSQHLMKRNAKLKSLTKKRRSLLTQVDKSNSIKSVTFRFYLTLYCLLLFCRIHKNASRRHIIIIFVGWFYLKQNLKLGGYWQFVVLVSTFFPLTECAIL